MKRLAKLLFLIAALGWQVTQASRLPAHYPQNGFQNTGIVDRVSFEDRQVVVNDTLFLLSDSTILHSLSSPSDSLGRLQKGAKIGYKMHKAGRKRVITEIWLLPGYYGQHRE